MALTDTQIRNIKAGTKPTKLADGAGLYLLVSPSGGKWWRLDYRFDGKRKTLSMGVYPAVSLKDARERREAARKLLASGVDPGAARKAEKASRTGEATNTFEAVAREWFARNAPGWAPSHSEKIIRRLELDVFPWVGSQPIAEINAPQLLAVLHRIEKRGAVDTAHRAQQNCGQIFRYAIATCRADRNPAADLKGALSAAERHHYAAITDPKEVGALLRAIDGFKGSLVVKSALRLGPLIFVRPGELRNARWAEIDLERAEWRYTVTKTKTEHLVPLARQAVEILRELYPLSGHWPYVFPGRDPRKPMSEAAVNAALRRMGYDTKTEITGHGFRAMARTIIAEELHVKPEVIEHQLAHRVPDALGNAYNRTKFLKERCDMMQLWADYLDRLREGGEVTPFQRSAS